MWHAIKTTEQNHFFKCSSDENCITYYLYDLKEVWSEKCNITDIVQKAKNLNKRICYDSETVVTTLKTATPTSVIIEPTGNGRSVILKYHIMGRPLNFEWNLKPIHADDFQKLITNPLFLSIHYLAEQIKELKKIIHKKDVEIQQYIAEGAVLQRKTVATEEFNEEAFNGPFSQVNEMSRSFLEISDNVKGHFPLTEIKVPKENSNEKTNRLSTFVSREKTRKSPNKKRKIFENRRQQMINLAKSKQKESMEFESSQSQSLSQTPPPPQQDEELAGIFQSLHELNAKRLASSMELEKHDSL